MGCEKHALSLPQLSAGGPQGGRVAVVFQPFRAASAAVSGPLPGACCRWQRGLPTFPSTAPLLCWVACVRFALDLARCSDIVSKKPSTLFVTEHPFCELEISPPHSLQARGEAALRPALLWPELRRGQLLLPVDTRPPRLPAAFSASLSGQPPGTPGAAPRRCLTNTHCDILNGETQMLQKLDKSKC